MRRWKTPHILKMCGFFKNGTYLVLLFLKVGTFLPFLRIRTKKAKCLELRPGVQGAAVVSAAQVRTMCGTSQYVNVLAGSCCRWWMASPNVWLWFFSLVPRVGQLWYNRDERRTTILLWWPQRLPFTCDLAPLCCIQRYVTIAVENRSSDLE